MNLNEKRTTHEVMSRWIRAASVAGTAAVLTFVSSAPARAEEGAGKILFNRKCAMCHGSDGVAKAMWAKQGAKNFNEPVWQKGSTDEVLTRTITDGIPDKKMPAYKDKLKPEEIASIVKHIRTLAPAK